MTNKEWAERAYRLLKYHFEAGCCNEHTQIFHLSQELDEAERRGMEKAAKLCERVRCRKQTCIKAIKMIQIAAKEYLSK